MPLSGFNVGMDETTQAAYLQQQGAQESAWQAHHRFLATDIPLTLASAGVTYGVHRQWNSPGLMTARFQELVGAQIGIDQATKGLLSQTDSTRRLIPLKQALHRVDAALMAGEPPEVLRQTVRDVVRANPSHPVTGLVVRFSDAYSSAFNAIAEDARGLQKMVVPAVARAMGVTTTEAQQLARENPTRFIRLLMSRALKTPEGGLNHLFSELSRAHRMMAGIFAASAAFIVGGTFLTRMELLMKQTGGHHHLAGLDE
ncbi:MAG: hypothetical protein K2X01_04085 [Cyanobacteria bacterium]|nr:hypothetical protein [Cyanobacteriota bacterium]